MADTRCPRCAVNPIADGYSVCERCAFWEWKPASVPGWEGSIGPLPSQYGQPHVYARGVHSGAGNRVCGRALGDATHVQAAPGVPIPEGLR
jgi:hypothetical protein